MQRTKNKLSVFLIIIPVLIACALRFFLLYCHTDINTGTTENGSGALTALYAVLLLSVTVSIISSFKSEKAKLIYFDEGKSKKEFYYCVIVSAFMFYDFVHQAYNLYDRINMSSYIEYTYVVALSLSGIFALLCCFYFGTMALSMTDSNFDFKNLTFMHFVPVLWCVFKLLMIMQRLVDFRLDVEVSLEFFTLSSFIIFFFCFAYSLDRRGEMNTLFYVFSNLSFVFSFTLCTPRIIMYIIGKGDMLSSVDYSLLTYIVVGLYIRSLSSKSIKADKKN